MRNDLTIESTTISIFIETIRSREKKIDLIFTKKKGQRKWRISGKSFSSRSLKFLRRFLRGDMFLIQYANGSIRNFNCDDTVPPTSLINVSSHFVEFSEHARKHGRNNDIQMWLPYGFYLRKSTRYTCGEHDIYRGKRICRGYWNGSVKLSTIFN